VTGFCTECGNLLTGGRFCENCGSPVAEETAGGSDVASSETTTPAAPQTTPRSAGKGPAVRVLEASGGRADQGV
jgi:hypothetical protein